jgi:hypothetical protein
MSTRIVAAKMFQKPYVTGGTGGTQNINDGYDTGYFALINSSTNPNASTKLWSMMATSIGVGNSTNPRPQWKQVGSETPAGLVTQGEFLPSMSGTNVFRGIYQTGFIDNLGATRYVWLLSSIDMTCWLPWPTVATQRYWMWHYQPWAWFGAVPQVIADIVMKAGLSVDSIDQVAFDNAYDAYDLTTGDAPYTTAAGTTTDPLWFGLASKWEIGCSRSVGEKCTDLIMKCAKHARDLYFVNESGKLSVASFTRPTSVAGPTLDSGIINVEWMWTSRLIYNSTNVSWGAGTRVSGNWQANPDGSDFSVSDEPNIASYSGLKLSASLDKASSIAKFGTLMLNGDSVTVNSGGQPRDVKRAHYPYLFTNHAVLNGGLAHVEYWINSDSKPRRFVTITQDFRALDWGIGSHLTNVAVTDDGQVIPEMWCIERTYDFDRLTVTSVLMERPPNT